MSQATKNKPVPIQIRPNQPNGDNGNKQWQRNRIRLWVGGVIAIMASVVVILSVLGGGQMNGKLTATSTSYDFGTVKMNNGLLKTSFQLSADAPTVVTKLTST